MASARFVALNEPVAAINDPCLDEFREQVTNARVKYRYAIELLNREDTISREEGIAQLCSVYRVIKNFNDAALCALDAKGLAFAVMRNLGIQTKDVHILEEALAIDATDITLCIATGRMYYEREFSYTLAEFWLRAAHALNPNNWLAINYLLRALYVQSKFEDAFNLACYALGNDPNFQLALYVLKRISRLAPQLITHQETLAKSRELLNRPLGNFIDDSVTLELKRKEVRKSRKPGRPMSNASYKKLVFDLRDEMIEELTLDNVGTLVLSLFNTILNGGYNMSTIIHCDSRHDGNGSSDRSGMARTLKQNIEKRLKSGNCSRTIVHLLKDFLFYVAKEFTNLASVPITTFVSVYNAYRSVLPLPAAEDKPIANVDIDVEELIVILLIVELYCEGEEFDCSQEISLLHYFAKGPLNGLMYRRDHEMFRVRVLYLKGCFEGSSEDITEALKAMAQPNVPESILNARGAQLTVKKLKELADKLCAVSFSDDSGFASLTESLEVSPRTSSTLRTLEAAREANPNGMVID